MYRRIVPLAFGVATACASSGSPSGSGIALPSERVVAVDNQGVYRTTVPPNAKAVIPAPPGRVFEALKAVYAELGVPAGVSDAAAGRVGNGDFWKSRRLGNEAISTYLNCGDSFSGAIADNYRVYISLLSAVRANGSNASEIETAFTATAQNMEGTSGARVACGTSGRLEDRIRTGVLLKVGAPAKDD